MQSPIAGPAPPELGEVVSATVWPTIGATRLGRIVGMLAGNRTGKGFFTLGRLLAVVCIPVALALFVWQLLPPGICRYRLTNRRIILQKGLRPKDAGFIGLEEFDAIRVLVLPGQDYLRAGELIFLRDGSEVFRLAGVPRPDTFREVCLKARMARITIGAVLKQQETAAASSGSVS